MQIFTALFILLSLSEGSIPVAKLREIGKTFVQERYGKCLYKDMIPYYDVDDEIIAYAIVFETLNKEPVTIIMGARVDCTPIFEFSKSLPRIYTALEKAKKKACVLSGTSVKFNRVYYFGPLSEYFSFSNNDREILIDSYSYEIYDKHSFGMPAKINREIEEVLKKKWQYYLFHTDYSVRDTGYVDSVPFIDWNYNCTATSAAMALWYWDYRDYGRLVDFYFDRWSPPYEQWKYNVPNVVREIAMAMGDTLWPQPIDWAIRYVANSLNGYNFGSDKSPQGGSWNQWNFSWIENEIDNGRPFVWLIFNYYYSGNFINHCCCGVGYAITPSDTFVQVHNTWGWGGEPFWPLWTYHGGIYSSDYVVTVVPGGVDSDNIFITFPTDSGIVFQYGDTVNITWDSYGSDIDYVKIWYANASTYDSLEWTLIDSCAPNTEIYTWVVPEESLCARINLQAFSVLDSLEAADGSFYSFTTEPTGISEENTNITEFTFNVLPNVFTNRLSIEFSCSEPISLEIYDISGRLIRIFPINLCNQNKYVKSVCWNGTDNKGKKVSSGIYFVSLRQRHKILVKKVVHLVE